MTLVKIRSLQLEIPRIHSKHGESAFSYYAQIRCAPTVVTFKSRLKTHLFSYVFTEWALCRCSSDFDLVILISSM